MKDSQPKTGPQYRLPKNIDNQLKHLVREGVFTTKQSIVTFAVSQFLRTLQIDHSEVKGQVEVHHVNKEKAPSIVQAK